MGPDENRNQDWLCWQRTAAIQPIDLWIESQSWGGKTGPRVRRRQKSWMTGTRCISNFPDPTFRIIILMKAVGIKHGTLWVLNIWMLTVWRTLVTTICTIYFDVQNFFRLSSKCLYVSNDSNDYRRFITIHSMNHLVYLMETQLSAVARELKL